MNARDGTARQRLTFAIATVAVVLAAAGLMLWVLTPPRVTRPALQVSQRDQRFHPGALTISRGASVRVVNDDGVVRHHAYIHSPNFRFDSGDQEPGHHSDIRFTAAGHFVVLCAIHPRMRLVVDVR